MFDLDRFIDDVRRARSEAEPERAIREVLSKAVSNPGTVLDALGEPSRATVGKLYAGPDLTILNAVWGPKMTIMPHNHRMYAVIGVYTGREDNIFWRRVPGSLEAAGARSIGRGEVTPLGADIIHSVTNPISKLTGAIHIYLGDFLHAERSEWEPESLEEKPYDLQKAMQMFEDSNRMLAT
jgi:predicted metal-dependent enzyme (double-stranded beta helix superfamily)